MSDTTVLYCQLHISENEPDGPGKKIISFNDEMTEGYEERLLMKLAHALNLDDVTSITLNRD